MSAGRPSNALAFLLDDDDDDDDKQKSLFPVSAIARAISKRQMFLLCLRCSNPVEISDLAPDCDLSGLSGTAVSKICSAIFTISDEE